jgi:predicted extracellular nuclease
MAFVILLSGQSVRAAAPTDLFFSEYIEGSSNNKALEIYNGTGAAIDLDAGDYSIQMYFNGNSSAGLTIDLTGTIANGDVYIVAQSSAAASILAQADQTSGAGWFNGDDAILLRQGTTVLDAIGQVGFDPGSEWGSGLISTQDNTLRRQSTICAGDTDQTNAFDPSLEWDGYATDTFDGLGSHTANCSGPVVDAAPAVVATTPAESATDFPIDGDLSVTFSEPVAVAAGWYALSCSVSGTVAVTVSGGPTTYTLNPDTDLVAGESCTLTISAAFITDVDVIDPPDNPAADTTINFTTAVPINVCGASFTPIYDIQGSGSTAAITGVVTTQGVVVGDFEGPSPALRGFYLQDVTGDGDPATSDGIFVFNSNNDTVALGDVVRVTGTAGEFQSQTQISSVSSIVACGTGTVAPVDVTLPVSSATYLEQYEGMLVRFPQTLIVTEHFQLGRFGQVVMSANARLQQPTNVVAPGIPALALQVTNDLNKIIVDDQFNSQNPDPILFGRGGNPLSANNTLRGGDTATGIVGVMTYTWAGNSTSGNAYRLRPVGALGGAVPNFQPANPRPSGAPAPTGDVRVAGMNLLNFFNTFSGCTFGVGGAPADCRGADNQTEFDRQSAKTVAAITGTQADVVGIVEIENDGYGANSAIQELVDLLNAATSPGTYAFIDVDAATSQVNALGTDAIKVGLIYKPGRVTPVGTTAALNTNSFVTGGDSAERNRPALAQAFEELSSGARFIVAVNHLKSKGSACDVPDAGDGQANCSVVRTNAANELATWLASDPTGTGDPDILITGDLNSYAKEDPIAALESAGYTNLIAAFNGPDAYSYVFDGQWGYLDHALGSASLVAQVSGVAEWHINADEPNVLDYNTNFKSAGQITDLFAPDEFRIADHDPILVDLDLNGGPTCSSASPSVSSLWPPNHHFVPVDVLDVTDPENDPFTITITGIFQDEAVTGQGSGNTSPDGRGIGLSTAEIRAERDARANGRVYHIFFTASNVQGSCSGELLVGVPKSVKRVAIDDGALYDSTLP